MAAMKLKALDAEDLQVVSAILQDAIVPICDIAFLPENREFVLVANRFKWEQCEGSRNGNGAGPTPDVDCPYERTNCAVRFEGVSRVSYRDIDLRDRTRMLSLLAVEQQGDGILLHFSGGGGIRLVSEGLVCLLEDIGEPWPTSRKPGHGDGSAQAALP